MNRSLLLILIIALGSWAYGQNCPGYTNAAISAPESCGNQIYYLEVPNNSCNGLIWFDIIGNSGDWGNEITWTVTSLLTGNTIASGGPYANNVGINVPVGPIDPGVEGQYFTITIYDSWGDGFNGAGYLQIEQGATVLAFQDANWSTDEWAMIFGANIDIYSSTITVTTPSGPVTASIGNCLDHQIALTMDNTNFCTTTNITLPWTIVCDGTGATLASGTQNVTIYPQIPTGSTDLVTVNWNANTCQWDISPQNDCDLLDIGTVFNISPDPSTLPIDACTGGSQDFTIDYMGISGGPGCCATGGPLVPITYNSSVNVTNTTVQSSPFGGTNNSSYSVIGPNGTGGNATSLTLTVDMTGYCFPDPPGTAADDYWVTVYVDGNIIFDNMFNGTTFSQTFNLGDIPGGYNENSIVEVYIYPNSFSSGTEFTTYAPMVPCGSLGNSEWSASTIDITLSVLFDQMAPSPANCTFVTPSTVVCCAPTTILDDNDILCSGNGTGTFTAWQANLVSVNPSCIFYSTVTPVGGITAPDGVPLNLGLNPGASQINQVVGAYVYCDTDGSGTDNIGDVYTLLSTYTLTVDPVDDASFSTNPTCDGGTSTILGTGGGVFSFGTPPMDGAQINSATGEVTNGTPGATYDILYTTQGVCPASLNVALTALSADDPSFNLIATCDGGVSNVTGLSGGTFSFNVPPVDAAILDPVTGVITNGTSGNTYELLYTTNGPCPASSVQSVTATLTDDPSFTMTPSCVGATIASVATPGGIYSFNPLPGDGAVIDPVTGEITMGTAGATYTIEYTTNGPCTATTTLDVTLTLLDDPSFTMTTSCIGALIATVATPGGAYSFNPMPGDGAVIDPSTGELTFGTPGTTYTIQYATTGPCAASTTIDITLDNLDDPSFVLTPTCDGGYVSSVTTPGGTYGFNLTPPDAAVIDAISGTISGGTPGATYDVIYITGGICSATTSQSVTAHSIPLAPVTSPDMQYCSSDDFSNMTVSGSGGVFTWYLSPPPANSIGTGASVPPSDQVGSTTYYVTETLNNCEGEASVIVINIEDCDIIIPTAFTPDNDLSNDHWEIVDLDVVYPNNIVRIYNRWGNILYESKQGDYASEPWRGKHKGNNLPVGSYYFIIELNDKNNTKKNGTVSIIYN